MNPESGIAHARRTRHTVTAGLNQPWECENCPARAAVYDLRVARPVLCRHCREAIVIDDYGVWHHAEDDAVVCAFGLDTEQPGEFVVQYAQPTQNGKNRD